jgi:hypothetical protein
MGKCPYFLNLAPRPICKLCFSSEALCDNVRQRHVKIPPAYVFKGEARLYRPAVDTFSLPISTHLWLVTTRNGSQGLADLVSNIL